MAVQLIKDDNGKTQYVVIPYHEYFRMCSQMAEIDDETDDDLEDIEVEHDSLDDVELPGDVCSIMTWQNVSLQAAWRILRGLSAERGLTALRPALAAVAGVLAVAEKFFVGHGRLVRMVDAHMLDVVVVVRHANHHFGGLAQVLTGFGKGVEHSSDLTGNVGRVSASATRHTG